VLPLLRRKGATTDVVLVVSGVLLVVLGIVIAVRTPSEPVDPPERSS
jgi:hypothetical protein